jgi:hypothetical protein
MTIEYQKGISNIGILGFKDLLGSLEDILLIFIEDVL